MSGETQPDPVTTYLAAVQLRAENVQECPKEAPDALWRSVHGRSARDVPPLLAAVEAALKHHQPGTPSWCGTCGPQDEPCQEAADIRRALLGDGA